MNFLELTVLSTDDDGMVQLGVRAASSTHAAYHETHLYPDSLASFGEELKGFPRAVDTEVVLECGSKDPKWHDYFRMRVFLLKATGRSALELESEVRGTPPVRAESHFFIPGMPADFNRLGSGLVAWLANPSDPFRVEWRNG
ncbi:MAG TPA: hypothetical protein VN705_22535 [Steroidobacteraceae bacterium]|jgi:hypothetical protein|nr:hypothetical protein [Steroidobacteraceae bacterium]